MQTTYPVQMTPAVKGQLYGRPRKTTPRQIPWLAQITQIRYADASAAADEEWSITVEDVKTGQIETVEFVSGASLAASLDNALAAFRAHGKLNSLFSVTEDGTDDFVMTARHGNREYTVTASIGAGSATASISNLQEAGGAGLEFGTLVVRGSADDSFAAPTASSVAADVCGALFRTDANHVHPSYDSDTPDAVDLCYRGKHLPILEEGEMWVEVEDAVTPASTPYMRVATTAGAGTIGSLRGSAAGGAKLYTCTPVAVNDQEYGLRIVARGVTYTEIVQADASATATEICNAFRTAFGTIAGVTLGGTATLTVTGADGEDPTVTDIGPGDSGVVLTTAADVDAIDVSSKCEFASSASAGGLARLRMKV